MSPTQSTSRRCSGSQKVVSASIAKRARGLALRAAETAVLTRRAYSPGSGRRLANGPKYGSFQISNHRGANRARLRRRRQNELAGPYRATTFAKKSA